MSVQQKWIFGGLLGGLLLLLFPPFLYGPAGAGRQWGFLLGFPAYAENSRRNNTRRARRPPDEGWTRAPRAENRRNNFARVHTRATLEVRI
jgi:hypothetical protein